MVIKDYGYTTLIKIEGPRFDSMINWSKKLSPIAFVLNQHNVKLPKFNYLFKKKSKAIANAHQKKLDNNT